MKTNQHQTMRRLTALLLALLLLTGLASTAEALAKKKKTTGPSVKTTATPRPTKTPKNKKNTPAPTVRATPAPTADPAAEAEIVVTEDGEYTDKDHVAAYLRAFQHLPSNYITKNEARALGWVSNYGNLGQVAPGKSIGGDRFGNYEGKLPDAYGRRWFECDIDFDGRFRNDKRILYSNDGLIYYTEDHYETFTDITEPETRAGP